MSETELAIFTEPADPETTNLDVEVVPVECDEVLLMKEATKALASHAV